MISRLKSYVKRWLRNSPASLLAIQKARGTKRFLHVIIDTVNICNLRCKMCYFSVMGQDTPIEAWSLDYFEDLAADILPHTNYLMMSCGTEPFMNREITKFVRIAKQYGVPTVDMVTNAVMMTPPKARELVEGGLDKIMVSIDGHRKETIEHIRAPIKYDRLVKNLKSLNAIKEDLNLSTPRLTLSYTIMQSNLAQIDDFIDWAPELGATALDFRFVFPYEEVPMDDELLEMSLDAQRELAARIRRLADKNGLIVDRVPDPDAPQAEHRCDLPFNSVVIRDNGDVRPCVSWTSDSMGNLGDNSFWEIWHSPGYKELRDTVNSPTPGKSCSRCPIRSLIEPQGIDAVSIEKTFARNANHPVV